MIQYFFALVFLLSSSTAVIFSQNLSSFFDEADALFGAYVTNGKVDYAALQANQDALNTVLATAAQLKVSVSDKNNYQAFWINAYNLAVIKGIIDVYPTNSPIDNKGFFDEIKYDLGGVSVSLDAIENTLLRAQFSDPRFHFVLVCGAQGCPPLISKAYRPTTLESQLQQQTIKAINNANFIKTSDGMVTVSELFKWYKVDFVSGGQTEIDFLNKYRKVKIPKTARLSYYNYDWRLNGK
jgi:hypothetical protein